MSMKRREFLAAGLALPLAPTVIALAQGGGRGRATPARTAKTTKMFKSPGMFPNGVAVMTDAPGGLWIGQQKITAANSKNYNLPVLPDADEAAWLVDWNGKLLKTVMTPCRNWSGIAYGGGQRVDGGELGAIRHLSSRHELQAHQPPPDPAQHRRARRRLPWREVAQRQAVDCRVASRRHPACRSQDMGSRSADSRELGREAAAARRGVRQRGEHLGRHRQQQHRLRRRETRG